MEGRVITIFRLGNGYPYFERLVSLRNLLWLLVFLAVLFVLPTQAFGELFTNPSFEDASGPNPLGWGAWGATASGWGNGYTAYRANDPAYPAYEGKDCVQAWGSDYADWFQTLTFDTDWTVGSTYYWGFWAKDIKPGGSASPVRTVVRFYDTVGEGGGGDLDIYEDHVIPNDGTWHYVEFAFTIPAGMVEMSLYCWKPGDGNYLFDAAYLDATPYTPQTTAAWGPSPGNGSTVGPSLANISWNNPAPGNPADTVTVDVFFLDAGTSPLTSDPDMGPTVFDPCVVQLVNDQAIETISLPSAPVEGHYYYWAVHATDSGTGTTTPGDVWSFHVTPYGILESADYTVLVNDEKVFTGAAGNYSFCSFDFNESVDVTVNTSETISQIKIMPTSLCVNYNIINSHTIEFTLDNPEMITVQVNGDLNDVLHLLTSYPETDIPDPCDANVLYYAGPGEYDIGVLELQNNETLYIEAGAKLNGMVFANGANNVKIRGRGIIDGTDNITSGNHPAGDAPWRLIYMINSQNIEIEGITLYNSLHWTIHTYQCTNLNIDNIRILNWAFGSDGTDLSSCQDVTITNSFYKTNDDGIVIKSLSFADNAYWPNPMIDNMDVQNILVEGCTIWNMDWGSPLEIGYELRCDRVSDITFRDCDILRAGGRGAVLTIHNTGIAVVENVLYENIRIENANVGGIGKQLFNLAIFYSVFSYDSYWDWGAKYNDHWDNMLPPIPPNYGVTQWRGNINNITYRDIEVLDNNFPYSIFHGWDSTKKITGVELDNIIVNGDKITSAEALQLELNDYVENIQFILNEGDINNDKKVDYKDFALFGLQWPVTGCGDCSGVDFTDDGSVTIDDLIVMCQNWLADYTP